MRPMHLDQTKSAVAVILVVLGFILCIVGWARYLSLVQ